MSIQPRFFLFPNNQGEQLGVFLFETLGPRMRRDLKVGVGNRIGEKMNGLPRGLLRPVDQPPGHRMGAGVTGLLSICSTESLGYRQLWTLYQTDYFCPRAAGQATYQMQATICPNCLAIDYLLA
jgi:hypothetical protein